MLLRLDDHGTLHEIRSVDTDLHPVSIAGDIIALDDDASKMLVYNWKTDERAYLDDHRLVVCARSIALYDSTVTHIATHSFGWVDGASVTPNSILILSQSDNSWASKPNSLELYSLSSNPPIL